MILNCSDAVEPRKEKGIFRTLTAVTVVIYIGCGVLLFPYYRYLINPDGISYISIAQKYADGNFSEAINGFWGPLISWLIAVLLWFGFEPLLAAKVLAMVGGAGVLIALAFLSRRFALSESIRWTVVFSGIPVVLGYALSDITPDLLLTFLLLCYFSVLFGKNYQRSKYGGPLCGLLGAFAYFAKSFAFPFFVAHFFLINLLQWLFAGKDQARKNVLRNTILGYAVFAVFSGAWVGLISGKYGYFTFGTSGKVAYSSVTFSGVQGLGIYWQGLLAPPNDSAVSIWEDPTFLEAPQKPQSTLMGHFRKQAGVTATLVGKMAVIFIRDFSVLSVVTALAYILFWLRKRILVENAHEVLYPAITVLIYAGGYSLVTVQARYLWILCLLSMLMGGYVIGRLFKSDFFTRPRQVALLLIFFVSFAVPAVGSMRQHAGRNKGIYMLGQALKGVIPAGSRVAASTNWAGGLYLSYYLDGRYYGIPAPDAQSAQIRRDLEKFDIDYYLVWGRGDTEARMLAGCRDITGGGVPGLKIYRLP